jgi:predicted membrane metal-binding protein
MALPEPFFTRYSNIAYILAVPAPLALCNPHLITWAGFWFFFLAYKPPGYP